MHVSVRAGLAYRASTLDVYYNAYEASAFMGMNESIIWGWWCMSVWDQGLACRSETSPLFSDPQQVHPHCNCEGRMTSHDSVYRDKEERMRANGKIAPGASTNVWRRMQVCFTSLPSWLFQTLVLAACGISISLPKLMGRAKKKTKHPKVMLDRMPMILPVPVLICYYNLFIYHNDRSRPLCMNCALRLIYGQL